jgi:hypothetical protein
MKISKSLQRYLFLVLLLASGVAVFLVLDADMNGSINAKRTLPLCASNGSFYASLEKLGEIPFGAGTENSKIAIERRGLGVVFTLNPKTGSWSFLTGDRNKKTCFVSMGEKWHRVFPEKTVKQGELIPVTKNDDKKQVGYSAPFGKMKEDLLKNGLMLVGYGVQDIDLKGSSLSKVTTYFFTDSLGSFTAVTSVMYKNKKHRSFITVLYGKLVNAMHKNKKHDGLLEISSVDAVGLDWAFSSNYSRYITE